MKRGGQLRRHTPLRPRSRTNRRRPAESGYVKWIRTLPCAVCDRPGMSEAAHTTVLGRAGMAQRSDNKSVIPLCGFCHRLNTDSYHQLTPEWRWADYHGIDLPELVHRLIGCWDLMRAGKSRRAAA